MPEILTNLVKLKACGRLSAFLALSLLLISITACPDQGSSLDVSEQDSGTGAPESTDQVSGAGHVPLNLDPSFGPDKNGVSIFVCKDFQENQGPDSKSRCSLSDVLIRPDGSILAAGHIEEWNQSSTEWEARDFSSSLLLIRLNKDGTPDLSFHEKGWKTIPGYSHVLLIKALRDDSFLVGFLSRVFFDDGKMDKSESKLIKFTPNGYVDTEFGDEGVVSAGSLTTMNDIVELSDGRLLVATNSGIDRLLSDGSPDNTFGYHPDYNWTEAFKDADGKRISQIKLGGMGLQADGSIIAGVKGYEAGSLRSPFQMLSVVRFSPEGILDDSFGLQGIGSGDLGAGHHDVVETRIAVLPDDTIVVGGRTDRLRNAGIGIFSFDRDGSPLSSSYYDLEPSTSTGGEFDMAMDSEQRPIMMAEFPTHYAIESQYDNPDPDIALYRTDKFAVTDTTFGRDVLGTLSPNGS